MKKKIRVVFFLCALTVLVFTVWSLIRTLRPSRGKAYERLSVEEACGYMSFEKEYCIIDVRENTDYAKGHVKGAKSLPAAQIVAHANEVIPRKNMMVYVYGADSGESCAAAQKLSDAGFTSVTETGSYDDWVRDSGCGLEQSSDSR